MSEEIKIGEYVRTKNKGIKRIDTIFKNATVNKYGYEIGSDWEGKEYKSIRTDEILKHSKNIVDLIEIDDIVVLEYYVAKYKRRIQRKFEIFRNNNLISFNNRHCDFLYDLSKNKFVDGKGNNVKIKKILTKEQFAQNEYRLEE